MTGRRFERTDGSAGALEVQAALTVDSSDWGDVIRLSGARYARGRRTAKSRFNEPSAPENPTPEERNEMNPISWCVVLRETGREATVADARGLRCAQVRRAGEDAASSWTAT